MTLSHSNFIRYLLLPFDNWTMSRVPLICSICQREFSRKFNARRHNENLHSSQAFILPLPEFRYGLTEDPKVKNSGFNSTSGYTLEDLLSNALERIGTEFEACEQELCSFESEKEKSKVLAHIIIQSLQSRDPKQTMKSHLRALRRVNLQKRIIRHVATGLNLPAPLARQLILNLVK